MGDMIIPMVVTAFAFVFGYMISKMQSHTSVRRLAVGEFYEKITAEELIAKMYDKGVFSDAVIEFYKEITTNPQLYGIDSTGCVLEEIGGDVKIWAGHEKHNRQFYCYSVDPEDYQEFASKANKEMTMCDRDLLDEIVRAYRIAQKRILRRELYFLGDATD